MKRNIMIPIVAIILLIFGYQNCARQNLASNSDANSKSSGSISNDVQQVIPLAGEKLEQVKFLVEEVVMAANGPTTKYTTIQKSMHEVDLSSGIVYITTAGQNDLVAVKYCLTPDLLREINGLLYSDSICKSSHQLIDGQVCSQVKKPPYALLVTSRETFELGSASDSCGTQQIDLCHNSGAVKNWFSKIKAQSTSLSCLPTY